MPTHRPSPLAPSPRARRAGFALILTLTLLAFLVVLLVGLATYTRIETAVAGNTLRQEQSRRNALVALDVALAQLQRHAGPDQRVTATAESTDRVNAQKTHYTGVWSTDLAATPDARQPLAWLVSGIETGANEDVTTAIPAARAVELVGAKTTTAANSVVARLQDITSVGVPGLASGTSTTIGRYAWWVGDQGVKAPVAVPDTTSAITYAPYDTADARLRLRQQLGLGAGAATAAGAPVFEPRDTPNSTLMAGLKVSTTAQLAFARNAANAQIGLTPVRQNYFSWSPNNFAVLANPKLGGLRQDLSLQPDLLGSEFASWADYSTYMEEPKAADPDNPASSPTIYPDYGSDPVRRRYKITSTSPRIAPVLSYFYLLFGVRKQTGPSPYTLSVRWAAALWNPYSAALVPEDLRLEISDLPVAVTFYHTAVNPDGVPEEIDDVTVSLRQLYGDPLKITLPWKFTTGSVAGEQSWLPGRVYSWVSESGASFQLGGENPGRFNSQDIPGFANGLMQSVPGPSAVNGNSQLGVRVAFPTTFTVKLLRANGEVLTTATSPTYDAVPRTDVGEASKETSQLGFLFRLGEGSDTGNSWLTSVGRDLRADIVPADALVAVPNGTDPANYRNFTIVSAKDRLLDRAPNELTYNSDLPVFELPRAPILSLGMLQHLALADQRPFAVGNSWGVDATLNSIRAGELFDRFFFSGLVAAVTPATTTAGDLLLANPLLRPLRKADGAKPTADDLRAEPGALSSKYLLHSAAFNLNSTSVVAWAAVLRSVRFPSPQSFTYLNASFDSGSNGDSKSTLTATTSAQFFRFSQSAQETYKADLPTGGFTYAASTDAPPDPPNPESPANTHLFRQGMRTLTPAQVGELATRIVDAIKTRHANAGPFRSLEEFLSPATAGAPSLLEQAIADANLNVDADGNPIEFSSQFLTQADIMTALAPVLFPRSDTFVIRTYGEAVNPAKLNADGSVPVTAIEGRAWCEAVVQRFPDYFDPTADAAEVAPTVLTSDLNKLNGRRFKVVSFRWLTRSDI